MYFAVSFGQFGGDIGIINGGYPRDFVSVKSNSIGELRNPTSARIFQLLKCQGNKTSHNVLFFRLLILYQIHFHPTKVFRKLSVYLFSFLRTFSPTQKPQALAELQALVAKKCAWCKKPCKEWDKLPINWCRNVPYSAPNTWAGILDPKNLPNIHSQKDRSEHWRGSLPTIIFRGKKTSVLPCSNSFIHSSSSLAWGMGLGYLPTWHVDGCFVWWC